MIQSDLNQVDLSILSMHPIRSAELLELMRLTQSMWFSIDQFERNCSQNSHRDWSSFE